MAIDSYKGLRIQFYLKCIEAFKNKDVEKMIVQYQNNIKTKVLCYRNGDIVRTLFFDKYGNPEEERLKDYIIKRWYYEYCSLP